MVVLTALIPAHNGGPEDLPPLTAQSFLTSWEPALMPLLGAVLVGGLYLYGVRRLSQRGDRWPVGRTVCFVGLGLASFLLATTSALAVYDQRLFWVHMVQHMLLAMVTPIFLALGGPMTLALRTLPVPLRRVLLALLHSRVARVVTFPVVAGALFVATPFALYLTGWYAATLHHPWLHELNHLHLVLIGALWFWPVLGVDVVPGRVSHPLRLLAVFATMPMHAFLGVAILSESRPIAAQWYAEVAGPNRAWGPSALADQHLGGALLWASGDLVALLVLAALFVQWSRASAREAVREDRRLDRLDEQRARAAR